MEDGSKNDILEKFSKFDQMRLITIIHAPKFSSLIGQEMSRNPLRTYMSLPGPSIFSFITPGLGTLMPILTGIWLAIVPTEYARNFRHEFKNIFNEVSKIEISEENFSEISFLIKNNNNEQYKAINNLNFVFSGVNRIIAKPAMEAIKNTAVVKGIRGLKKEPSLKNIIVLIAAFGFKFSDKALLKPLTFWRDEDFKKEQSQINYVFSS